MTGELGRLRSHREGVRGACEGVHLARVYWWRLLEKVALRRFTITLPMLTINLLLFFRPLLNRNSWNICTPSSQSQKSWPSMRSTGLTMSCLALLQITLFPLEKTIEVDVSKYPFGLGFSLPTKNQIFLFFSVIISSIAML